MGRHIRWPAIITFTGIALTLTFLGYLSLAPPPVHTVEVRETYREAIVGVPQFINPILAQYNQVDQDLSALIFRGLTRPDGSGGLEPDLAEAWESSEDGLNYLFTLKQGIRWQDNEPFNADDVVFTISLMQDPAFPGVPYLHNLWQSVTVQQLDSHTLRFTLSEPFPAFTDFTTIGILPEHLLTDVTAATLLEHPFNLKPIGTGPFKLVEINEQRALLEANPYFSGPPPHLSEIELHFFQSYQETITAYETEAVTAISYVPPQAITEVQALESLTLYSARQAGYLTIYLNLHNPGRAPFFAEASTRQALMAALDRSAIIQDTLNGQGLVASGPIHPWSWAYNPQQQTIGFDVAKAKDLLDMAGWVDNDGDGIREKGDRPFSFTLLSDDDPTNLKIAEALQEQWAVVGIEVQIEAVGPGLNERLAQHDFQAALAEIRITGDPDPYPLWHESQIEGGQNYSGWQNERASALLEAARTVTDTGPRNDAYYEFQDIFAEEVPALILFYPVYTYGISQEVLDVQIGPLTTPSDRFRTITEWHIPTKTFTYTGSDIPEDLQAEMSKNE